ncbi:hypothetical protein GCM10017576_23510 [Microbacterium barkeri]|uniref:Uncharacterized protein n=1 Tax=Microbacterium barkeri TaxID=33917 RepID=A0A9W6H421_9MICO|nr:hypothetical protein [Microbacterium barkeri]MDI6944208.1 hypothetical protein [Microbacterium barkeri]MDR6876780.1 hypothetical protein [Microbacterium barkeri]GLJ62221.1 hypothetical protein GCM10017576_23510 [Microbacterium barkeri]
MIARETTPEEDAAYEEWLEDGGRLSVIFLAYKSISRRPKALFAMSRRDAIALCMDKGSAGQGWMVCHTRLENWEINGKVPTRSRMKDTGKLDPIIEELGLTKIPL